MYSGCAKLLSECTTRDGWTGAAMGVYHILTDHRPTTSTTGLRLADREICGRMSETDVKIEILLPCDAGCGRRAHNLSASEAHD